MVLAPPLAPAPPRPLGAPRPPRGAPLPPPRPPPRPPRSPPPFYKVSGIQSKHWRMRIDPLRFKSH